MRKIAAVSSVAALAISAAAVAADIPEFRNTVLTIPRVDTADQIGRYQNVVLELDPQAGTFVLKSLSELGRPQPSGAMTLAPFMGANAVELIMSGSNPTGVFLRISGFDGGCQTELRAHQRRQGNRFEVSLSQWSPELPLVACTASVREFKATVPLEVYGLAAGTYTYSVNGGLGSIAPNSIDTGTGKITGKFTLTTANKLPGD